MPSGWTGPPGIAGTARARNRCDPNGSPRPSPGPCRPVERKQIKALLESDEFVDEAPATVYAKLLDQGIYLGSVSTMYRILHEHDEVRERRRQATHPAHKKPELIATTPNSVWSWDITKLHGPEKWTYYYLYVILDIYSRYAVGWMLARVERAELSKRLITDTIAKQGVHQRPAHPALGPGVTDDRQTGGPPAGRPRGHQVPQPAPREQRQPVLGIAVPDLQVPTGLPRPVRQLRGRPCPLCPILRLV